MDRSALEHLITSLAAMNRGQLIEKLRHIRCTFPLDFTDEYLEHISLDNLRHITMAASLHQLKACA